MKAHRGQTVKVFLCGALLGACLGLFLAPRAGSESQAIVKREVGRSAAEAESLGRRIGVETRRALEGLTAAAARTIRR